MAYTYSLAPVCAMIGNFRVESTVNPGIWESLNESSWTALKVGFGLGQWTNTSSSTGRLYQLHAWLSANGYSDGDGEGQLEYLVHEATWYKNGYGANFSSLNDFLTSSSTDIETLTKAYMQGWEGLSPDTHSSTSTRVAFAQSMYELLTSGTDLSSYTTWVSTNAFLSTSNMTNNAVLVYKYMCLGESASGGTDTSGSGTITTTYNSDDGENGYTCSAIAVAALCGNFHVESTVNPDIWEGLVSSVYTDYNIGYGLAQWENTSSEAKLIEMYTWLYSNGYQLNSGFGQLDFLWNDYDNWDASGDYGSLEESVQHFLYEQTKDVRVMTCIFAQAFYGLDPETESTMEERMDFAEQIYELYTTVTDLSQYTTWIYGNAYLTEAEQINNCMLIYRFLCNGGVPVVTETKTKKKMPIWMMSLRHPSRY